MVAPPYSGSSRSLPETGLMTISSVSTISSTVRASRRSPARITTAKRPVSGASRPRSSLRPARSRSSSRTCSRARPATRSMRGSCGPSSRISSATDDRARAKAWPPARIRRAGMMATVRGMRRTKLVPCPAREVISTWPPIRSMWARTTSMPTPRPEMLVTVSAVEKPGAMIRAKVAGSDRPAASSAVSSPWATARARIRSGSSPRPSSSIRTLIQLPSCIAPARITPPRGFPARSRSSGVSIP